MKKGYEIQGHALHTLNSYLAAIAHKRFVINRNLKMDEVSRLEESLPVRLEDGLPIRAAELELVDCLFIAVRLQMVVHEAGE
jgi:hypothetical protein